MTAAIGVSRHGALVALAITCLCAQSYSPEDLDTAFERDVLVIEASARACHRFEVWLARSREQQTRGLMFVREMAPDSGMLFVYASPGVRSMWMKNTYVPLDIVFVRDDGVIASIIEDTEPLSLARLSSTEPVAYVLELAAGRAEALGIGAGDRVTGASIL